MTRDRATARPRPDEPGNALMICARRDTLAAAPDVASDVPRDETRLGRPWLLAAGAAATAIPAAPGVALAALGHPQAIPLLISSGLIGLVSVITSATVKIHENVQRTRRLQIQHAGTTALANAMARCLDDAHAAASDLPAESRAAEAASVRAAAMGTMAQAMPAMLAAFGQQNRDCGGSDTEHTAGKHPETLLKRASETSLENRAGNRGLDRVLTSTQEAITGSGRKLAAADGSQQPDIHLKLDPSHPPPPRCTVVKVCG